MAGFDAGSITAYLKLDRTDFDEGLEQAQADAKEFEEKGITVPLRLDQEELDESVDEAEATVDAAKASMEDGITVPARIDNAELAASAVEAEAIIDAIREETGAQPGLLSLGAANMADEVDEVRAIMEEASAAADQIGARGLLGAATVPSIAEQLAAAGVTPEDLIASGALGANTLNIADIMLGSPAKIAADLQTRLQEGFYAFTQLAGDDLGGLYSILGGEKTIVDPFSLGSGTPLALPSGLGNIAIGPDGLQAALGPAIIEATATVDQAFSGPGWANLSNDVTDLDRAARLAASSARTARLTGSTGTSSLVEQILAQVGGDPEEAMAALQGLGMTAAEAEVAVDSAARGADDVEEGAGALSSALRSAASFITGGGGRGWGSIFSSLYSSADNFTSSLDDAINKLPLLSGGLPGLALAVPTLGALGLAAGGALAGTSIGLAGTAWAFLPGLLDLYKGYEAYSAEQSGQSTKGMTSGALGIASAIKPLVSGTTGFLGGLESDVDPQIVAFLNALTAALPAIAPFADAAVGSMSKFFDVIDQGLQSGGFRSFMATMTKDVGPIMDEFGKFLENAGVGFGDFLKLFGSGPAQMVGEWFDTETGKFDRFMQHIQFGPGFIDGAKTVFTAIGAFFDLVGKAATVLFEGLAPVGLTILHLAIPAFQGLAAILGEINPNAITAIAVALLGIEVVTEPWLAVAAAILAVGYAYEKISGLMAAEKPMTAANVASAYAGFLTPAAARTPAETAAINQANLRNLTPSQIGNLYNAQKTTGPTPGGIGFHSPLDTAPIGDTAAQLAAWKKIEAEEAKASTVPPLKGLDKWMNALEGTGVDFKNWGVNIGNAATGAWGLVDHNFVQPVVHFFVDVIPNAFDACRAFLHREWSAIANDASGTWHLIDNDFVHPIVDFFENTIPNAFDRVVSFFTGLPDKITKALGDGKKLLSGWGKDLIDGIGTGISSAGGDLVSAIKKAFDSIPGFSAIQGFLSKIPGMGFISALATGGSFSGNMPILVGENGPELMMPKSAGYVVPNNRLSASGTTGGGVTIYVDARGSTDVNATQASARSGVQSALPQLRSALQRGTGSLAGVG